MTDAGPKPAGDTTRQWVALVSLGLLVLPFDPHWIDFEQVRRGLLLMLTGALALALPRLPRVQHEGVWIAFLAFLGVTALANHGALQPWEAWYRIAHFTALLFVLRLGAGAGARDALATPLAILLAMTSAFGLLQRLGLAEIAGYGAAIEPVSVFGNLNVASEWTAVAAVAVAVLRPGHRTLQLGALVLAGTYLVVNGSRSGMVATAIGLALFVALRRETRALLAAGLTALGAGAGLLLLLAAPLPGPTDPDALIAMHKRASATLDVRFEIARSSADLFAERPLLGWGPGQFQVQYPRVRSQQEIEISSQSRQFASEVRTAHNDWIELLIEGGLPAVLLFVGALFVLQRRDRDKERLLPLFVLLLLMIVRSPLGNAPAVTVALLPVASVMPGATPAAWRTWGRRGIALLLLLLGLLPVMANMAFAPYLAARGGEAAPGIDAPMRAHAWMWWEPRWLQVLAQEHLGHGDLPAAQKAAAMATALRPHDPQLLLLEGETLARSGDYDAAAEIASRGLAIDPPNPELRVLRSTTLMLLGRHQEAVVTACEAPHPTLRRHLEQYFRELADAADRHDDATGAARCRFEAEFLATLDSIGEADALIANNARLRALATMAASAGVGDHDLRPILLSALQFLALDDPETAASLGTVAQQRGLVLADWQRALIGDALDPLLEHEAWAEVLRRRAP